MDRAGFKDSIRVRVIVDMDRVRISIMIEWIMNNSIRIRVSVRVIVGIGWFRSSV